MEYRSSAVAVRLDDVFVDYGVFADKHLTLRRLAAQRFKGRDSVLVHALKGISNTIYEGEVLGVVGQTDQVKHITECYRRTAPPQRFWS